jgi:ABC-type multidrug transport system ATPase subunit
MIRIERLTKSYGRVRALSEISLEAARGEGLGLAGPNGSGRTTLLRILAALVPPTSGTVEVCGLNVMTHPFEVRRRVGYAGDEGPPGGGLSVGECLQCVARARLAAKRADKAASDAAARLGLDEDDAVATLPAGRRQRLAIAAALLPSPDVILLDDPLRALDAASRVLVIDWLRAARDGGAVLLVAANTEDDLRALCHRTVQLTAGLVVPAARLARPSSGLGPEPAPAPGRGPEA